MFSRSVGTLALAILPVLVSCAGAGEPLAARPDEAAVPAHSDAPITTDSTVYRLRSSENGYSGTIELTYTNRTGGTVNIPACHSPHPPILEKRVDGEWVVAYDPPVLMCITAPVVIQAGSSYAYTYRIVAGPTGSNMYPQFQVAEIPGTYRLRWRALVTAGPGQPQPLPEEETVSQPFELRR
jgi:hypothetical protein